MSNISLFKQGGVAVPGYLRELDDTTKALAGSGGGKSISIKGGVWRMLVGGEEIAKNEDRAMNFIIIAAAPKVSRTFYLGKYEEGKVIQPACWSADGVAPNAEVPAESRQSKSCDKCPQNISGSGEGKSRACRFSQRLAVTLENDIEGNIYRLQLPAMSIFGKPEGDKMPLQAYAKFLAGHGVPITGVVTEARFDTSAAVPMLTFRAVRPLEEAEWNAARIAAQDPDAHNAIDMKITLTQAPADEGNSAEYEAPAPAAAEPIVPKPKSKPVAEADADSDEPTKRPKKPVAAAPAETESKVSSILDEWGTDDEE